MFTPSFESIHGAMPMDDTDPVDVQSAVTFQKKRPPPESTESIRTRSLIIFSFWALVILLGLPIWWKTTSIYRAKLPLGQMMDWAEGRACRPAFPLQITLEATALREPVAQHLLRLTQHALDDLNDFSAHHLRLQLAQALDLSNSSSQRASVSITQDFELWDTDEQEDTALIIRLTAGESGSTPIATLEPYRPVLDILYAPNQLPSTSSSSSPLASFIADKLQEIFAEEQAMIAYLLSSAGASTGSPTTGGLLGLGQSSQAPSSSPATGRDARASPVKALPADLAANLARRTTRSLKYSPTYHLTFSLFTPNAVPSSWDIEAALTEWFTPLLRSLSTISNFTIDTQVQLYASFSPSVKPPEFDSTKQVWTLPREDLSGFINAAEWPLSPGIGEAPTVNFVLYVPSPNMSPLVVKENGGNSWLIPQWGGVTILNLPFRAAALSDHLTSEDLRPALLTFSHQLMSLLGTPQSPPSLPIRLLTLTRVRAASLLLSASSTLGSLARLTLALPSIAIPQTVATSVDRTLAHLSGACADFRDGRFHSALEHARVAEAEAEHGFFEKSMVGQVYFPDEHKIAVYLPLLGPVCVPLLLSAVKEAGRVWNNWKRRSSPTS